MARFAINTEWSSGTQSCCNYHNTSMCQDQTSNDLLLIFSMCKCYQNTHTHSIYITKEEEEKKLQHKYMIIKLTNNLIASIILAQSVCSRENLLTKLTSHVRGLENMSIKTPDCINLFEMDCHETWNETWHETWNEQLIHTSSPCLPWSQ